MHMTLHASLLALVPVLLLGCEDRSWRADVGTDLRERAAAIHRESIVLDGHNDVTSFWIVDHGFDLAMDGDEGGDRSPWLHWMVPWLPGAPTGQRIRTQIDFARAERGGLDAQFFSVWVSPDYYDADEPAPGRARERANAILDSIDEQLRLHPDRMQLARTADEVRRIAAEGRLAALVGIEGGHAIEDDLQTAERAASASERSKSGWTKRLAKSPGATQTEELATVSQACSTPRTTCASASCVR